MATDAFLNLDGIKGESVDDKHKGEIELQSFQWGLSQAGSGSSGTGSGVGKVAMQDFHFTKVIDKSSPSLQLACASGKHIANATISVRKAGENPLDYFIVKLENVLVSSYHVALAGSAVPAEQFSLNYSKVSTEYWTQNAKGAKGDNANFAWDVAANKKA